MIRLKTASALTALAIASIATNAGAAGFVTAGANMADGKNGYIYQSIFTTGETVGGYTPIGLMDGIGAYALNKDTVRVLVNHEAANNRGTNYTLANGFSLAGSRISYFDVDKYARTIVGSGLAYDAIHDRSGNPVSASTQLTFGAISRLCSAVNVEANAYGAGRGVVDRIFFSGEESGNGTMFALDTATNKLHAVADMGYGSWENAAQVDTGTRDKVAFMLSDDTSGSAMMMYVGTKSTAPGASFLERNGLVGGEIYAWKADAAGVNSSAEFNGGNGTSNTGTWVKLTTKDVSKAGTAGYDAQGYALAATMQAEADALGAFSFSRPEDVATNVDGKTVAFATTGSTFDGGADTWGQVLTFELAFDANGAPTSSTATMIYNGNTDASHALRSPDNLDWADADTIIVQEDRSASWASVIGANPQEASVLTLELDGSLTTVATINRTTSLGQVDVNPTDFGNWESSGILDVSTLFGYDAPGALFIGDVQAHSVPLGNNGLVESSQLFFLSNAAVPEPASWAMMIAGFGLVGSAMRRRHLKTVAA